LLLGGWRNADTLAYVYDPASDTWTSAGRPSLQRANLIGSIQLPDGRVVLAGGSTSTVDILSTSGVWSASVASGAVARNTFPVVFINNP